MVYLENVIDPALKQRGFLKLYEEAFVRSTTAAFYERLFCRRRFYERLTQPTATDTTLPATPKCPYEKFDTHFQKGFSFTCLSLLCMTSYDLLIDGHFRALHYRNAIKSFVTRASIATLHSKYIRHYIDLI